MTFEQPREMLPNIGDAPPDYLATIDPKTAHSHLLHLLQNGDIIRYYEDNPADRDALEEAIQESTRPMLEPTPVPDSCDRDIDGNAIPVTLKYTAQHEKEPDLTNQDVAHDWSSAQSETLPGYPRRDLSEEQAVGNGETHAGGDYTGKE